MFFSSLTSAVVYVNSNFRCGGEHFLRIRHQQILINTLEYIKHAELPFLLVIHITAPFVRRQQEYRLIRRLQNWPTLWPPARCCCWINTLQMCHVCTWTTSSQSILSWWWSVDGAVKHMDNITWGKKCWIWPLLGYKVLVHTCIYPNVSKYILSVCADTTSPTKQRSDNPFMEPNH